MDPALLQDAGLMDSTLAQHAQDLRHSNQRRERAVLCGRRLPAYGWDERAALSLVDRCVALDSGRRWCGQHKGRLSHDNNNSNNNNNNNDNDDNNNQPMQRMVVGAGEREGRVYSGAVERRCLGLVHGVGRSGDLTAAQPKAAGSSAVGTLAHGLALDVLQKAGARGLRKAVVVPMCTGMTLSLVLSAFRTMERRKAGERGGRDSNDTPDNNNNNNNNNNRNNNRNNNDSLISIPYHVKNIIIWCRIDQKACLKSMITAGMEVVVINGRRRYRSINNNDNNNNNNSNNNNDLNDYEDQICISPKDIESALQTYGNRVLAVMSTTSCFAPRAPDDVIAIARLCQRYHVYHVINNAYGVQSIKTMNRINTACNSGRVDAVIQSTDKNFMVPVGGAVIASPSKNTVDRIAKTYAGRASASPMADLVVTLLCMGSNGWHELVKQREEIFPYFKNKVHEIAKKYNERILESPFNPISFAMTLNTFTEPTQIGRRLFWRGVTGPRVVVPGQKKEIEWITINNWGAHINEYNTAYLTHAAAIGQTKQEVEEYIKQLDKILKELKNVK